MAIHSTPASLRTLGRLLLTGAVLEVVAHVTLTKSRARAAPPAEERPR